MGREEAEEVGGFFCQDIFKYVVELNSFDSIITMIAGPMLSFFSAVRSAQGILIIFDWKAKRYWKWLQKEFSQHA